MFTDVVNIYITGPGILSLVGVKTRKTGFSMFIFIYVLDIEVEKQK